MRVRVKLLGLLAIHFRVSDDTIMEFDVKEGTTCYDVAVTLNLPKPEAVMFSMGGILKGPAEPVNDGDEIQIFMPLAGG